MQTMQGTIAHVLIVEDEAKLAMAIRDYLNATGFTTQWVADGRDVISAIKASVFDLVLLDLMLPGRNGLDICRELRSFSDVPLIMLTARIEEIDRLLGLEIGADDYICKPFSIRELVARAKAILRRSRTPAKPSSILQVDETTYQAIYYSTPVPLTSIEFRLLKTLSDFPGRVFSRDGLLDRLHADHRIVTDRTVDTHIKNLRRKLQQVAPDVDPIRSIYGVGYKLEIDG
jgi:two-component system response regulator BaeR